MSKAPESVRSAALKVLDGFGGNEVLRRGRRRGEIQRAGAAARRRCRSWRIARPSKALPMIKRFMATGSETEQQAAFQAMALMQPPQAAALLVGALDQLAAGKVQPGAQVELLNAVEQEQRARGEGALGEAAGDVEGER